MSDAKVKIWDNPILQVAVILLMAYFQLFHRLDRLPIQKWDEGKNAVSAYEMLKNKDYLVRYYEGEPDDWGFKPPLLTWHQAIFMKCLGANELAVRLPSAIYALLTVLLLFRFANRALKLPAVGLLSAFVLLTSFGYLDRHIARTGDHDSMLVFFLSAQAIYYFKYLEFKDKRNRYLAIVTLALVLGTLTKGVAGLAFIPGFILYGIVRGKVKYMLLHRQLYLALLSYGLLIFAYYFYREMNSPGYLSAVWENELIPRYANRADNPDYEHLTDYFYYIRNFWHRRLVPWIYFLPFFLLTLSFTKDLALKSTFRYLLLIAVSYLIIFSFGTKHLWYDAPLYPPLALLTAMGLYQWFSRILILPVSIYLRWALLMLIGGTLLYFPVDYTKGLTFALRAKTWQNEELGINYFLREKLRSGQKIQDTGIAYSGYHAHIRFYMNLLNDSGSSLYFVKYKQLEAASTVIACENMVKEYIEQHYDCTEVYQHKGVSIYRIGVEGFEQHLTYVLKPSNFYEAKHFQ